MRKVSAQPWAKDYKRQTFALLALRPGRSVLDVGCGRGDDVIELAGIVAAKGRAVGVDRSATMVDAARSAARSAGLPAEFVEGDATALPFADATFDACRIDRTLEHLSDPMAAVRELVRVCKPGGRVAAAEPDWDTLVVGAPDHATTRLIVAAHTDEYAHGTIGRALRRLFVDAGLHDVTTTQFSVGLDDMTLADAVFGLRLAVVEAVKRRRIDRTTADAWWAALQDAQARGAFWSALSGTMAAGTKR